MKPDVSLSPLTQATSDRMVNLGGVFSSRSAAWIALGACLVATVIASLVSYSQERARHQARFQGRAEALQRAIIERLHSYVQVLKGAQGLFAASQSVEAEEWRAYFDQLGLANHYRGFRALGYIEKMTRSEHVDFLARSRLDNPRYHAQDFRVWPSSEHSEYFVVRFAEPLDSNAAALGYDIATEPAWCQAAVEARDTGTAALTRKIRLIQDAQRTGVLLLLPIYRQGIRPPDLAGRRAALQGWVYAAFAVDELFAGIRRLGGDEVGFEIYDGPEITAEAQLYDDDQVVDMVPPVEHHSHLFTTNIDAERRTWTLRFNARPMFAASEQYLLPRFIAAGGLCISLLVFGIARSLLTSQQRAVALANQMTEKWRASHQELKATQLQLIQAAKMESIGTLAAGVAHEVKNPLQTILMGLAYLKHNYPPVNENIPGVLEDMQDAVKRANSIVRELLQLSATNPVEMKEEDLNEVIERSLWLLHYEIMAGQFQVTTQLARDLPPVRLDRSKMEQVFVNLVLNALQAMPRQGRLAIATRATIWDEVSVPQPGTESLIRRGHPVVMAEIQDSGPGIPEEHLARLFDPFFTTKAVGQGTGLGLSVVKRIVDMHGGLVRIHNVSTGGAHVTIVLRASAVAQQEASESVDSASL
jgi:signal transduction histidine kinase